MFVLSRNIKNLTNMPLIWRLITCQNQNSFTPVWHGQYEMVHSLAEFVAILLGGNVVIVVWSLAGPDDLQPFYLKHPRHA